MKRYFVDLKLRQFREIEDPQNWPDFDGEQGRPTAALTFLPGLLLGWLFLRTGSLLSPILFHGLANVSYAVMALTLAQP